MILLLANALLTFVTPQTDTTSFQAALGKAIQEVSGRETQRNTTDIYVDVASFRTAVGDLEKSADLTAWDLLQQSAGTMGRNGTSASVVICTPVKQGSSRLSNRPDARRCSIPVGKLVILGTKSTRNAANLVIEITAEWSSNGATETGLRPAGGRYEARFQETKDGWVYQGIKKVILF